MTVSNRTIGWGQKGLLALVGIMPFHAFVVVWLSSLVGHQNIVAAWKELLLVILTMLTISWLVQAKRTSRLKRLQSPLILLMAGYAIWSLVLSLLLRIGLTQLAFGAKTNLEFLVAFVIAYCLATTELSNRLARIILIGSGVVAGLGLIQVFLLPADFLRHFGYGATTILPYEGIAGSSAVRILSTLGGPNQLGSYLILPLCLTLALALRKPRWWQPVLGTAVLLTLLHTYSRSAWIAAVVGMTVTLLASLKRRQLWWAVAGISIGVVIMLGAVIHALPHSQTLQYYIYHNTSNSHYNVGSSDGDRLSSQNAGVRSIKAAPLGHGLGSAGPASFHTTTPLVTESYYLQLGVEVGLVGLALFVAICALLAGRLWLARTNPFVAATLGALVGVSAINLFLHGWTDSSTALIFWTFAGSLLGEKA